MTSAADTEKQLGHEDEENRQEFNDPSQRPEDRPYTAFSPSQKRLIVFLVALAGFFSPFSAFIFFPSLKLIAGSLSVSLELINLTITMYMVVQGFVPLIFGQLSETQGRRPIYLLVFTIYLAASLGLSFQNSYAGLLVLRMLQSVGSSGTIALAYGVIADIAPSHERGGYVGIAHVGFNSAPSLGPVLGGVVAEKLGWKWIFRLLSAFSGAVLLLMFLVLPETARSLVENGSRRPVGIYRSLADRLASRNPDTCDAPMHKPTFRSINPLMCLRLLLHRHSALILPSNAIFYAKYSCLQASLAQVLQDIYHLSTLQTGLCYLAFGTATAVASYAVGMISNYDYRITARKHRLSVDRVRGDVIKDFPIEKARLRTIWLYIFVSSTSTLGYGWALQAHTHIAVALILQFLVGLAVTGIFNCLNTLFVDLHSEHPAMASAAVSLTRCLTAAAWMSVLQLLFRAVGYGWTFTLWAGLCYGTVPLLWAERRWGWQWRRIKEESR